MKVENHLLKQLNTKYINNNNNKKKQNQLDIIRLAKSFLNGCTYET